MNCMYKRKMRIDLELRIITKCVNTNHIPIAKIHASSTYIRTEYKSDLLVLSLVTGFLRPRKRLK